MARARTRTRRGLSLGGALLSLGCGGLISLGCETVAPNSSDASDGTGAHASTWAGGAPGSAGGADGGSETGGITGASAGAGGAQAGSAGPGGAPPTPSRGSCKRGVAYGYHTQADLQVLSKGVSWWYNWALVPDEQLRDGTYRSEDVEFVPMVWGAVDDFGAAIAHLPGDTRTLLGFNEPNFGAQANLSAAEAAALWPELEASAIAAHPELRLVSPAVNYCGGDCQDTSPFDYLEDFFAACEGCQIDAIGIHIYVACSPAGDNKAQYLIDHVENYKSRFHLPLWLTEFACDSASSMTEQRAFMEDAVAYLEAEPRIERYAWFAGRADNVGYVDLLGEDGQLTTLGQAYVAAPQDPDCVR